MAREVSKGELGGLILAVLAESPLHGYAIAREVERRSENAFLMREGSLYPALRVLEQDELIRGDWQNGEGGPQRKVYQITERGLGELARKRNEWEKYARTIGYFLGSEHEQSKQRR